MSKLREIENGAIWDESRPKTRSSSSNKPPVAPAAHRVSDSPAIKPAAAPLAVRGGSATSQSLGMVPIQGKSLYAPPITSSYVPPSKSGAKGSGPAPRGVPPPEAPSPAASEIVVVVGNNANATRLPLKSALKGGTLGVGSLQPQQPVASGWSSERDRADALAQMMALVNFGDTDASVTPGYPSCLCFKFLIKLRFSFV